MNTKVPRAAAASLLVLLAAAGCLNYNNQPEGAGLLMNTGNSDSSQTHSLDQREYGIADFEKSGLSASAYISGNTIIFYAGGCDTFTANILSNSELSPFAINPMNTIDDSKCQQDNESTRKLQQHLQNVADNVGTFRVLKDGGFTLDRVPFGLAFYDWVTPPALPYNFYGDVFKATVQEVNGDEATVEPIPGSDILRSGSRVAFVIPEYSELRSVNPGDLVEVWFDPSKGILESFPLGITATEWRLITNDDLTPEEKHLMGHGSIAVTTAPLPATREEALHHPDYVIDPGGGVAPKACWNETPGGGGSFNGDECDLPWWPATVGAPLPDDFEAIQIDPQLPGSTRTEFEMRIMNALGDSFPKAIRYDADTNLVIITIFAVDGEDVPMHRINKYRQLGQQAAGGILVEVEVNTNGVPTY